MVNADYVPLGFCLAYFEDDETVSIHGYFGDWLKIFPKDILRSMKDFTDRLREHAGVTECYAIADESVEGSVKLIEWVGGEYTGKDATDGPVRGPIYICDLSKTRI